MATLNNRPDREKVRAATAASGLCSQLALAAARVRDGHSLTEWDRGLLDRATGLFSTGAQWLRHVDGATPVAQGTSLAAPTLMDEGWLDRALPDAPAEAARVLDGWVALLKALAGGDKSVATTIYTTFQQLAELALADIASPGEVLLTAGTE